jgi:hypothetical protein
MTHTEAASSLASERYLLDEMNEAEQDAFETHFFECSECAEDVKMGALMTAGARAGLLTAPQLARIATFPPAQKQPAPGTAHRHRFISRGTDPLRCPGRSPPCWQSPLDTRRNARPCLA